MFKNRQKIVYGEDFCWESKSWVYNAFRAYELLFGRRYGKNGKGDTIRAETSISCHKGVVVRQFYTVEALLSFYEQYVRGVFTMPEWKPVRIWIPMFSNPMGLPILASPYLFAIAFDTSGGATTTNNTTTTVALAATGSNRIAVMGVQADDGFGNSAFVSITVGGTNATQINTEIAPTATRHIRLYYFVAPPTSSTNYVLTNNAASVQEDASLTVQTYSGAAQTGQPDSSANNPSAVNTNLVLTTTVVASNCWLVSVCQTGTTGAGTGTTQRQSNGEIRSGDSNGTVGTGSRSMTWNNTSNTIGGIVASIAPVPATTNGNFLAFM